jgi:hypothetical protein
MLCTGTANQSMLHSAARRLKHSVRAPAVITPATSGCHMYTCSPLYYLRVSYVHTVTLALHVPGWQGVLLARECTWHNEVETGIISGALRLVELFKAAASGDGRVGAEVLQLGGVEICVRLEVEVASRYGRGTADGCERCRCFRTCTGQIETLGASNRKQGRRWLATAALAEHLSAAMYCGEGACAYMPRSLSSRWRTLFRGRAGSRRSMTVSTAWYSRVRKRTCLYGTAVDACEVSAFSALYDTKARIRLRQGGNRSARAPTLRGRRRSSLTALDTLHARIGLRQYAPAATEECTYVVMCSTMNAASRVRSGPGNNVPRGAIGPANGHLRPQNSPTAPCIQHDRM